MTVRMFLRDPDTMRGYLRLLNLSERELANRAGIGHATLNHLLSGRRATCSARTAAALEHALACPDGLFFAPFPRAAGWPASARTGADRRGQ